jgi:nicotinate-nucleotide pyrophosphorylase (carboxylating)
MTTSLGAAEGLAARALIDAALQEDLGEAGDVTSNAMIPGGSHSRLAIVCRKPGVIAGLPIVQLVFDRMGVEVELTVERADGSIVEGGTTIAVLSGPTRGLLTGERTVLNFLTHLSGVATLTRQFVKAVAETRAVILDTRKTIPGWRVLQKYAVRCGGGTNHRMGLFDAVLIKDNHLAAWRDAAQEDGGLAAAIRHSRSLVRPGMRIEIEVDTLAQLEDALAAAPEIVLLDNMSPAQLRAAVELRDRLSPATQLEASGGVTLETVREIAGTGVDRISIGALTHSAPALDIAFDWAGARSGTAGS